MLLRDLPITLKSFRDCADSAQKYFKNVQNMYEPLTLFIGIYTIEVTLKAIIEEYGGYLPEEDMTHSCSKLAKKANELWMERGNMTKPLIPNDVISKISRISHFTEDGRYPNRENEFFRSSVREDDFRNLSDAYRGVLYAQKVVKKIIEVENSREQDEELN